MLKNFLTTTKIAATLAAGFILVAATDGALARGGGHGGGMGGHGGMSASHFGAFSSGGISSKIRLRPPIIIVGRHHHHGPIFISNFFGDGYYPYNPYYASNSNFDCMPGTLFTGRDGLKHVCQ
jgi:hypothetical protein